MFTKENSPAEFREVYLIISKGLRLPNGWVAAIADPKLCFVFRYFHSHSFLSTN